MNTVLKVEYFKIGRNDFDNVWRFIMCQATAQVRENCGV